MEDMVRPESNGNCGRGFPVVITRDRRAIDEYVVNVGGSDSRSVRIWPVLFSPC